MVIDNRYIDTTKQWIKEYEDLHPKQVFVITRLIQRVNSGLKTLNERTESKKRSLPIICRDETNNLVSSTFEEEGIYRLTLCTYTIR